MADFDDNYKTFAEDRLTSLPFCLILHILSLLDTKEVVQTSVLSKKWQFIWTDISKVKFEFPHSPRDEDVSIRAAKIRNYADFVGRTLTLCRGLHTFDLTFKFEQCITSSTIDFWIECLVRNKVNNIKLASVSNTYELPQMFYSYSALTSLKTFRCEMKPQGVIEWGSLKKLSMEIVKLSDIVMQKLLLGCPVLKFLQLKSFEGLSTLNVTSRNLTTLVVEELFPFEKAVEISAPYVRDLTIRLCVDKIGFNLKNFSSLVRARLDFSFMTDFKRIHDYTSPGAMVYINQLFQNFHSVKELELGLTCIEVLSVLEMKGWKLPPSMIPCLTINAYNHVGSIPGIVAVLKSSQYLQTLAVEGHDIYHEEDQEEDDVITRDPAIAYLGNANLDLTLNHLKTIKMDCFVEFDNTSEPLVTFVCLLLRSAKFIEKMEIDDKVISFLSHTDATTLLARLLTFPGAYLT